LTRLIDIVKSNPKILLYLLLPAYVPIFLTVIAIIEALTAVPHLSEVTPLLIITPIITVFFVPAIAFSLYPNLPLEVVRTGRDLVLRGVWRKYVLKDFELLGEEMPILPQKYLILGPHFDPFGAVNKNLKYPTWMRLNVENYGEVMVFTAYDCGKWYLVKGKGGRDGEEYAFICTKEFWVS